MSKFTHGDKVLCIRGPFQGTTGVIQEVYPSNGWLCADYLVIFHEDFTVDSITTESEVLSWTATDGILNEEDLEELTEFGEALYE